MSLDPKKLYRNRIGADAQEAQRATRDAMRSMLGKPAAERLDIAAKLRLMAFAEGGLAEESRQRAVLMAAALTADISIDDMRSREREMAEAIGQPELAERSARHGAAARHPAASNLQRANYEVAVRMSRDPAFTNNEDDSVALRSLLGSMDPGRADHMTRLLCDLTLRTSMIWQARWGQCAFPVATLADVQYASSLCTTTMPVEFAEDVRAPWRAFMIRLPADDLLVVDSPSGGVERVERILAHQHFDDDGDRVWSYVIEGQSTMLDRTCIPAVEMCVQVDPEEADDRETQAAAAQRRRPGTVPNNYLSTPRDRRTLHMAARLIVGVCMAFGVAGAARRVGLVAKSRRRKQPFPTKWEFIVGRPVRVDATDYVRSYISGTGGKRGPRTTQSFVSGHWKWQPYGERSALRKWIHIEPYYAGPDDAPIVVRPHILKGANDNKKRSGVMGMIRGVK